MNRASLPFFFYFHATIQFICQTQDKENGKQVRQFSEAHADVGGSTV